MKTSIDIIASGSSIKKANKKETNLDYIKRTTHCELSNRNITELDGFQHCATLSVLYLYDNSIHNIFNLQACKTLTRLHLANNKLCDIKECFKGLFNLTYLNLRSNFIQHVEGLEESLSLEELHLDKQNLKTGQNLSFASDTLASLSGCLKVLTITMNAIGEEQCIEYLSKLSSLETLDISNNFIQSVEAMEELVTQLPYLRSITITGNPIKDRYIRQKLIRSCATLESISDKEISDVERIFTERLGKLKKAPPAPKRVAERKNIAPVVKPIPHLPAFASQYRDMYLQKLQLQMQDESSAAAE